MLFINSNVAPSVTVNVKTADNSINEELVICMSYEEKANLYNTFAEEDPEKWPEEKKAKEIIGIVKDVYIGDKNAAIMFNFDNEFVQEQEKQKEFDRYLDSFAEEEDNEEDDREEE